MASSESLKGFVIATDYVMDKNCKMQKTYLIMILEEAHAFYIKKFQNKPIKLAKFCAL
jgi:hypothetical protein